MLKLTNIVTTLRNNWKKSVFFTGALGYGAYYLLERKRNGELMQAYCLEALKYSREKINPEKEVRRVTVFLNPVANKERGRFLYDKNVAPLLHLSGLDVRLVRLDKNTEANEHIKEIDLDETDCIVVAGGNATLNEVISGLLNRELPASGRIPPLAVIPIGQTNTFAQKWYNILGMKHSNEAEIRLLASSAMAIIRGETIDADVIKVSLIHNSNTTSSDELIIPTTTDKSKIRNGGTHKLLKEDQLYALSNFSCGFLTETEANVDTYRYFWKLKEYMNRYFTDRYLRRDPLKYELAYTIKCPGCARCLNASALQRELDQIGSANKAGGANSTNSSTLLRLFYNKVINVVPSKNKEDPVALAKREKRKSDLKILLEKSKKPNNECGKIHKSLLTQVQIIASINNPELISENSATEPSYIDTAIVKDPTFNPKSMFLAERKELDQFEIKRLQSDKPKFSKTLNSDLFSVEIDGEIYKLSNTPETELSVEVKHLEKRVKMIRADPNALAVTGNSPWPKVYLVSNKTFEEELMMSDEQKNSLEHSLTPNLLRFEKFYLKYWMSRDEFKQQYSHS